jgi:hypothetical protein
MASRKRITSAKCALVRKGTDRIKKLGKRASKTIAVKA